MAQQQQTYRVTLSDGRAFDVTTDGGPPSEESIYASLGSGTPDAPEVPEWQGPPVPEHPYTRVGRAGVEALKAGASFAARASGVPGFVREGPIGAVKDQVGIVRDLLQAQFDQYHKAKAAQAGGRTGEMVFRSMAAGTPVLGPMAARMGEQIAGGELPEMVGELGAGALMYGAPGVAGAAGRGARAGLQARRVRKAAETTARVDADVLMAVPPSKTAGYTSAEFRAAKPYLNAQHEKAPITTVTAFRDAADNAIGEIEGVVSGITAAFPEAQLNPLPQVHKALTKAFADNPRGGALEAGLRELDDLPLNRDLTLPELDRVRLQLNAENRATLKRNNYDQATARKAEPAFAAREAAAAAIRDVLYDYLEARGVKGVRELRRDEGALIRIRNAANRQEFSGARPVAGSAEAGPVRRAIAQMADKGATAVGASVAGPAGAVVGSEVGELLGTAIRGGRQTRDALISRAFAAKDAARPVFPVVPARRPVRGALPPVPGPAAPRPTGGPVVGPSGAPITTPIPPRMALPEGRPPIVPPAALDDSGPIPPTLPENYRPEPGRPVAGPVAAAADDSAAVADVAKTERAFILRWLADDLREITHQPGGSTRGQRRAAYEQGESAFVPAGSVSGTPTQEMFHAAGIKGTRLEIAARLDRYLRTGKGTPQIEALADAMRQAWDGQRFDFSLIDDRTLRVLGVRRREMKGPITMPNPDDMPQVYERFFPENRAAGAVDDAADDFSFADDAPSAKVPPRVKPYRSEAVHITTESNAEAIRREGFRVRGSEGLGGDDYGPGVYLADRASDAGSWWREQLATKNETGRVPTAALVGDVKLDAPLVLEQMPPHPNSYKVPTHREMLERHAPELVEAYEANIAAGMTKNRALGAAAKSAGYDGLVLQRRAGDEIVAFDPKAVKWAEAKKK